MARSNIYHRNWKFEFEIQYEFVIRGHRVYKSRWTPTLGKKLTCHEDKRKEAKEVDEYAIGMYMEARHVLVELLFLIYMFLNAFDQNEVKARVAGSRKLENGLVVPAAFIVRTTKRAFAMKFENERSLWSYEH